MNELKVINIMNEAMLRLLENKNLNCEKNLKIRKILKDETIFFKIDKLNAFKILQKVGVKQEQLENVYKKLISPDVFYELLYKGKLQADDKDLIIKYETKHNDLFKKTN